MNFKFWLFLGRLRDANDRHVDSRLFLEDEKEVEEEVEEDSDTESVEEKTVAGNINGNVIWCFRILKFNNCYLWK